MKYNEEIVKKKDNGQLNGNRFIRIPLSCPIYFPSFNVEQIPSTRFKSYFKLKVSRSFLITFLFFLEANQSLFAQPATINTEIYIKTRLQSVIQQLPKFSSNSTFNTSLFEDLILRTETKEFDFTKQSYSVRLGLNSKKTRQAEVQLFRQLNEQAAIEREQYYRGFLISIYKDWLEIYRLSNTLFIQKELLSVHLDIETVILELGRFGSLQVKDFLEAQSDIIKDKLAIQKLEKELANYLDTSELSFEDLTSINLIEEELAKTASIPVLLQQQYNIKERQLNAELSLEEVSQNRWFDFLQLKYAGPHKDPFKEKFSIGAGFIIPTSSNKSLKWEEIKTKQLLLQEQFQVEQVLYKEEVESAKQQLIILLEELRVTKPLFLEQQNLTKSLVNKASQQEGASPVLQLFANLEKLKQQMELFKLEVAIYEQYIEYLSLTEQIFSKPFRNYLLTKK